MLKIQIIVDHSTDTIRDSILIQDYGTKVFFSTTTNIETVLDCVRRAIVRSILSMNLTSKSGLTTPQREQLSSVES